MKILKPGKHRLFELDFETAKIVAELLSDLGILCFNVAQVFSLASLFISSKTILGSGASKTWLRLCGASASFLTVSDHLRRFATDPNKFTCELD